MDRLEKTLPKQETEFVHEPKNKMAVSKVDGFTYGKIRDGEVVGITQGQAGFTKEKPIRTDNLVNCICVITKTTETNKSAKFGLVHVWDGDFRLNHPDHREDFLRKNIPPGSEAIIVYSDMGQWKGTSRDLERWGIKTTKVIKVDTNNWYGVLFTPDKDEIAVRLGNYADETSDVLMFDGFGKKE